MKSKKFKLLLFLSNIQKRKPKKRRKPRSEFFSQTNRKRKLFLHPFFKVFPFRVVWQAFRMHCGIPRSEAQSASQYQRSQSRCCHTSFGKR